MAKGPRSVGKVIEKLVNADKTLMARIIVVNPMLARIEVKGVTFDVVADPPNPSGVPSAQLPQGKLTPKTRALWAIVANWVALHPCISDIFRQDAKPVSLADGRVDL